MSSRKIEISVRAFTKVQLHAAKYPHCAVNGVLLACKQKFREDKVLHFVDAIPLFHQAIQLTAMLEVALMHIDSHCSMNELYIAAYYEIPKQLKSPSALSTFTCRVADKVHENFGESVLITLDNERVPDLTSFKIHERVQDGKWKLRPSDKMLLFDSACNEITDNLLEKQVYRDLTDFDNHLDDISHHWLNQDINKLVEMQ